MHYQFWFSRPLVLIAALICASLRSAAAGEPKFAELRRFDAEEATQGVAVEGSSFYAIGNKTIGRYDKQTGERLARWEADREHPLTHLNGGVVVEGKLYCAHSNFPVMPATSSVEIWNAATLEHVGNHSFGIADGSLTWIDHHDGTWWACFAHYNPFGTAEPGQTDNRWTTVAKLNDEWQPQQKWVFPAAVLARFGAYSCSGGTWGDDGRLYCSGHDRSEVYAMRLPKAGATLVLDATIAVPIRGQGIAWDRSSPHTLFGIDRAKKQVVVCRPMAE